LTSSEQYPKFTENSEYYSETEYEDGLKKFYPVCKLKIPECLVDTGDTGLAGFSINSEKIPKNTRT